MNPKEKEIVFALIASLLTLQAKGLHVGMDELFLLIRTLHHSTKKSKPGRVVLRVCKVRQRLHDHIVGKRGLTV